MIILRNAEESYVHNPIFVGDSAYSGDGVEIAGYGDGGPELITVAVELGERNLGVAISHGAALDLAEMLIRTVRQSQISLDNPEPDELRL